MLCEKETQIAAVLCGIAILIPQLCYPLLDENTVTYYHSIVASYSILVIEQVVLLGIGTCSCLSIKTISIILEISYPIGMMIHSLSIYCFNRLFLHKCHDSYFGFISLILQCIWCFRLCFHLIYRMTLPHNNIEINDEYSNIFTNYNQRYGHVLNNFKYLITFLLLQYLTIAVNSLPNIAIFYCHNIKDAYDDTYTSSWFLIFLTAIGVILCIIGLLITTISDYEKLRDGILFYTKYPKNGLWKYNQRINYIGEMIFWIGNFLFGICNMINNIINRNGKIFDFIWIFIVSILGLIHIIAALSWFANIIDTDQSIKIKSEYDKDKTLQSQNINKTVGLRNDYQSKTRYLFKKNGKCGDYFIQPRPRIGWGLGMHQVAHKEWM